VKPKYAPAAVATLAVLVCIQWECSPLGIVIIIASYIGTAVAMAALEVVVRPRWVARRHDRRLIRSIAAHPANRRSAA
jgi:hypothetical protein